MHHLVPPLLCAAAHHVEGNFKFLERLVGSTGLQQQGPEVASDLGNGYPMRDDSKGRSTRDHTKKISMGTMRQCERSRNVQMMQSSSSAVKGFQLQLSGIQPVGVFRLCDALAPIRPKVVEPLQRHGQLQVEVGLLPGPRWLAPASW